MAAPSETSRTRTYITLLLIAGGSLAVLFIVAAILAAASAIGEGYSTGPVVWRLVAGIVAVLMIPIVIVGMVVLVHLLQVNNETNNAANARLARLESLLEGQNENLGNLSQLAVLSNQAKSLIYHEQEIEAFRETVNAMLLRQDYKSAAAMIDRMEKQFGLVEEASRMRDEVAAYQQKNVNDKISSSLERIDKILQRREWAQARREADRIVALFPDNPKVQALPAHIQDTWNAYKRQLLKAYGEAVRVNDVERSIDLLKELDKYLTPQEGAALQESARGVFKAKLHNLGVQFAISVTDQQWTDAVSTGEEIMKEFPNSRMAREVSEKLGLLRAYASGEKTPPGVQQFIGGPGARV